MQTDREQPPAPVPTLSPAPLAPTPMMPPVWFVALPPRPRVPAGEIWLRLAIAFALGIVLLLPMEILLTVPDPFVSSINAQPDMPDILSEVALQLFEIAVLAPPMLLAIGSVFLDRDVWRDLRALRALLVSGAALLAVCGLALLGLFVLGQILDSISDLAIRSEAVAGSFFLTIATVGFVDTGCVVFAICGRSLRETALPLWFGPCAGFAALLGLTVNVWAYTAWGLTFDLCTRLGCSGRDIGNQSLVVIFFMFMESFGTICTLPAAIAAGLLGGALRAQLPRLLFRPPRG